MKISLLCAAITLLHASPLRAQSPHPPASRQIEKPLLPAWTHEDVNFHVPGPEQTIRIVATLDTPIDEMTRIHDALGASHCVYKEADLNPKLPPWRAQCSSTWYCPKKGSEAMMELLRSIVPMSFSDPHIDLRVTPMLDEIPKLQTAVRGWSEDSARLEKVNTLAPAVCSLLSQHHAMAWFKLADLTQASNFIRIEMDYDMFRISEEVENDLTNYCRTTRDHRRSEQSSRRTSSEYLACAQLWPKGYWFAHKDPCDSVKSLIGYKILSTDPPEAAEAVSRTMESLRAWRLPESCNWFGYSSYSAHSLWAVPADSASAIKSALEAIGTTAPLSATPQHSNTAPDRDRSVVTRFDALNRERAAATPLLSAVGLTLLTNELNALKPLAEVQRRLSNHAIIAVTVEASR